MPSKVLIQVAEDFHRRCIFPREGIEGGDGLSIEGPDALEHVQGLRDIFVDKVLSTSTDDMGEEFIADYAQFIEPGLLQVGERRIRAKRIVIASGSTPIIPGGWKAFGDRILTTDEIFELEELPESLAVIGLGVIGLELGQAFHRLGVKVTGIDQLETIGRLDDPEINKTAIQILGKEMPLWLGHAASIEEASDGRLRISAGDNSVEVEKVLVCIGRRPNLTGIGIENAGVALDEHGIPDYNPNTMQIEDKPLFIAGDVNGDRPVLHEAADEGRIAGINAASESTIAFRRKTPLFITFSDPNLVLVGKTWPELDHDNTLVGSVALGMLGRALIMGRNKGQLRLYADKTSGKLLGASMVAPHGEHLGHLLNWCIEQDLTLLQMVRMPFYHPVLEEAIQPVLREMVASGGFAADELPPDLERL